MGDSSPGWSWAQCQTRAPKQSSRAASQPYRIGGRVSHPKYGEGVVAAYQGQGPETEIKVSFPKVGDKWFILDYARLTAV